MLECDGYKMFHGTVRITPVTDHEPFDLTGTWLWKPDWKCWYCQPDNGGFVSSWAPVILSDFRVHEHAV